MDQPLPHLYSINCPLLINKKYIEGTVVEGPIPVSTFCRFYFADTSYGTLKVYTERDSEYDTGDYCLVRVHMRDNRFFFTNYGDNIPDSYSWSSLDTARLQGSGVKVEVKEEAPDDYEVPVANKADEFGKKAEEKKEGEILVPTEEELADLQLFNLFGIIPSGKENHPEYQVQNRL